MEPNYFQYVIIFIFALVTFNLVLTLKLIKLISINHSLNTIKSPLKIGSTLVNFSAKQEFNNTEVDFTNNSSALVLIFLNSDCQACKEKINDVNEIINLSIDQNVYPYIITAEPNKKFHSFLNNTYLLEYLLLVDNSTYDKLNPQGASPSYLFINESNVIEAEGFIGDENWTGLKRQLNYQEERATNEKFNTHSI